MVFVSSPYTIRQISPKAKLFLPDDKIDEISGLIGEQGYYSTIPLPKPFYAYFVEYYATSQKCPAPAPFSLLLDFLTLLACRHDAVTLWLLL
jgi:hypothetical protein